MTSSPLLPADASVTQFLQASVASDDPTLAAFVFQRVFPVIICAEATADDGTPDYDTAMDLADQIRNDVKDLLETFDCDLIGEIGPFDGSREWSLFYRSKKPEDGHAFEARIKRISNDVKRKMLAAAPKTGNLAKVGTAVGKVVIVVTTGAAVATTLHVPIAVYMVFMLGGEAVTIVENTKRLFFGS